MLLNDGQLRAEMERCLYCESKPCQKACPADCSPADFIMAAKTGMPQDFKRAAAIILGNNPLGGVCGAVCPDKHCMSECRRALLDRPINIPAVQATIVAKARELGVEPEFELAEQRSEKVAILGAGPAGYGAAASLAQMGFQVDLLDTGKKAGGMCALIPDARLDKKILQADLEFAKSLGAIRVKKIELPKKAKGTKAAAVASDSLIPASLQKDGYRAVVVSTGLTVPNRLGVPGEEATYASLDFLADPARFKSLVKGKTVAVIGGGAVAADCAETAVRLGAKHVELFALEALHELPLTANEKAGLEHAGVHVSLRTRIKGIVKKAGKAGGLKTVKVALAPGKPFHPRNMVNVKGTDQTRAEFQFVIMSIGNHPAFDRKSTPKGVFFAGDVENGPTTVVEAVAAGKNAAMEVAAFIDGSAKPKITSRVKSAHTLHGLQKLPVSLETDFFGRKILSPFLLSAAPPSDGYEQMKKAYEAGWAGGVMKTAFDGIPIHIPSQYMFAFNQDTYGNCDNVSGHPLDRVCREIQQLVREYPDRLTMASTGGPVTGNDAHDKAGWQHNTKKLEKAGVMGIEYSLSCPQGGDGTKGDIVSQDPELTAKIIDWVMEVSDPNVPKLFKLTAAVTAIYPIMAAIKEVFAKYPGKKAGVTLANTFPTLAFRAGEKKTWEEGVVVGMSGDGVTPISNLTLANVSKMGITVSGNGGPMNYKAAADFLALGARTVQFCTVTMKYGYGIIDELHSGLSHLMEARGIYSVDELIGRALPNPITGFMELSPVKKISAVHKEKCIQCGNCTRCPYLAISVVNPGKPSAKLVTDASKCVGCSICVQKCPAEAMYMRERTKAEAEALQEA